MSNRFSPKLEIFVGATKRDLGGARQAVINAILEKGHIPSGMELWAAGNRPPLEVIARHLERCDAHILIVGARYGSQMAELGGISFTEWEYRQSLGRRPILPFLFDSDSLKRARRIEKDKREKLPETKARLDSLRDELLATKYVKEFHAGLRGSDELQRHAILAIDELIKSEDISTVAGWIRGDSAEARTVRDIANNPFLRRELEQLRRFSTLGLRVGLDVGSKEALAKAFWWNMQGRIRRHLAPNLFFESGSTTAYLSDEFVRAVAAGDHTHPWHIRTNNILSLLHFDLHTSIDASRFPGGIPDPEDKYGAIFPPEWHHLLEPFPDTPRSLHDGESQAVSAVRDNFRKLTPNANLRSTAKADARDAEAASVQPVLAAASGLDLDNKTLHFRGPHVGSHPNMLFKRAIFASGYPVVLFLSAEKVGNPFRKGSCYPVFGPDEPWTDAVRKYPLAICVGYEHPKKSHPTPGTSTKLVEERNAPEYILRNLKRLGFGVKYFDTGFPPDYDAAARGTGAVMCGNEAFNRMIPRD